MNYDIDYIVSKLPRFNYFVSSMEAEIPNQSHFFDKLWLDLEMHNASALDEWEQDGMPDIWDKWVQKYQVQARVLTEKLLSERVPENNIVCDITHFLHFADWAESEIPSQSHLYAEYWWELESFKTQILEDWEKHGRPLEWEKWNRVYKSKAFKLVKKVRNQHAIKQNMR